MNKKGEAFMKALEKYKARLEREERSPRKRMMGPLHPMITKKYEKNMHGIK